MFIILLPSKPYIMIQFVDVISYLKKRQTPLLFFSFAFVYPVSKVLYARVQHYLFPPEKTKTEVEQYVEKHTQKFLKTFDEYSSKEWNTNVSLDFYDNKKLKASLREANNELERAWKTKLLFEYTPRGNIVMYYDPYKMGFAYYSDNTSIPYSILNAVAMKYVTTFRCHDFFFDNQDLKKLSPLIKIHSTEVKEESKEQKKESDAFKQKMKDAPFLKRRKQDKKEEPVNKESKETEIKKEEPPKHINCFVHMGKMYNFSFLNVPAKIKNNNANFSSGFLDALEQETSLQKQVMNYKDYKNSLVESV